MLQFKNLKQVITTFSDEQVCRDFLVQQRWNGSPVCPYCGSNKWYSIENRKRFKCGNKECYKKYSVTVGTCFHASNIPLTTWMPAMYLLISHKKGISSCQLARDLGVSQKTAWFMLHRIRESLRNKDSFLLKNTVEVDEIYIGGRGKNLSNKKRAALRENITGNYLNKTMVMGMLERGGELRFEVTKGMNEKGNIPHAVFKNVDKSAILITDSEGSYKSIGKQYAAHESVNHIVHEYVRNGNIHTNTIEGAFGLFRRVIIGTYHKLSPKHLSRYCDEMQYRYNTRVVKDGDRFENALSRIGSRLSWKELTKDNGFTADTVIEPEIPEVNVPENIIINKDGRKKQVAKILNGKIIATYPSLIDASIANNLTPTNLSRVVRGLRKTTGGYEWKYI